MKNDRNKFSCLGEAGLYRRTHKDEPAGWEGDVFIIEESIKEKLTPAKPARITTAIKKREEAEASSRDLSVIPNPHFRILVY